MHGRVVVVELPAVVRRYRCRKWQSDALQTDTPCVVVVAWLGLRNHPGVFRGTHRDKLAPTTTSRRIRRVLSDALRARSPLATRPDLGGRFEDAAAMHAKLEQLIVELREQGWFVFNPYPRKNRRLYVIELDLQLVQGTNDGARGRTSALYVGETSHPRGVRFEQHRECGGYTNLKPGWAVRLRPDLLFGEYAREGLSLGEALTLEARLAEALRSRGHFVLGGH